MIDIIIAVLLWAPSEVSWRMFVLHEHKIEVGWDFHEPGNLIFLVLYFGLANYLGNGQTPGKWIARTRAVSLVSPRLGKWQSIERALGFLQYFWSPNRMCAQDRLAETIVIDVRKRKSNSPPGSL